MINDFTLMTLVFHQDKDDTGSKELLDQVVEIETNQENLVAQNTDMVYQFSRSSCQTCCNSMLDFFNILEYFGLCLNQVPAVGEE